MRKKRHCGKGNYFTLSAMTYSKPVNRLSENRAIAAYRSLNGTGYPVPL